MMPEVGLPKDVIVICPQTGITAGSFLGLLTGHLGCICLNRQVTLKCLLSCTKHVACGGVRAGVLSHTPTPCCLIALVTWKGLSPPSPCSWFLGAPRTLELLTSPTCPQNEEWVWVSQLWHMTCLLETFYISWHHDLSKIVLCASARSAHMLWVCLCSLILQWVSGSVLWAPWHAKASVCPLRNAWNIHVCLTVPNTSVSFAIFPPHQFQTNSLLDTKKRRKLAWRLTWSHSICAHPCCASADA